MGERRQINMDDDIEKYCIIGVKTFHEKVYPTPCKQKTMPLIQLIQPI